MQLDVSSRPLFCGRRLNDDEVPVVYAIHNWCTDRQGDGLDRFFTGDLLAKWLKVKGDELATSSKTMRAWANTTSKTSRLVAGLANPHREFFGRKAVELQIAYEKDELKMPDRSEAELQEYVRRVSGLPLRPQDATGQ